MATNPVKGNGQARDVPTIPVDRLALREAAVNDWQIHLPRGVTIEDLEDGRLWAAVAQQLRAYDLVRVVGPDQTWWGELIVRFAVAGRAVVKVIRTVQLGAPILSDDLGVPDGHRIEQGAPGEGWTVYRDSDGVTMARGVDNGNWTRQQALAWLLNHASLRQTLPPGTGSKRA